MIPKNVICLSILLLGIWLVLPGCHNSAANQQYQSLQTSHATERDSLETQLADMKESHEQIKAALSTVTEGYQKLKEQSNKDKARISELEGQLLAGATESAQIQFQLNEQIKTLTQERDTAAAKTQELQTAINTLNAQIPEKDKKIAELEAQIPEKDKKISELEAQVQNLQNIVAEIQKKLQEAVPSQ
jgi:chromosome segregation ATPase